MHFSSLAASLAASKNPLYLLHDELKAAGTPVLDLVKGNVNDHGIAFPQQALREVLAQAADAARIYRPDSFGQYVARQAISRYYDAVIPPEQILLTPGTSVSYWYCFKLLAEPGDRILTPQPSYPLFDYIARLCGVELTHYRLDEGRGWAIDLDDLEQQIGSRTRAIVLISPHNPTGMVAGAGELQELAAIAARYEIPIIADEVFSEFLFETDTLPRPAATSAPLVFTLNGFSKMFALPGMKVGWAGVTGDDHLVERALSALELISDTFLPVNEIAQFAVPGIFSEGRRFLPSYTSWVAACRNAAAGALAGCEFAAPAGGFYLTLRLRRDEEAEAMRLLRESRILVHPGYFYDIPADHLVMTFINDPEKVHEAFQRIARVAGGTA
jgi:aspartate/methionine/tyrosine aminotransferase